MSITHNFKRKIKSNTKLVHTDKACLFLIIKFIVASLSIEKNIKIKVSLYQFTKIHTNSDHICSQNMLGCIMTLQKKNKKTEGLFYVSPHLDAPELDCISSRNVWTTFGRLNVQSSKDDGIAL